MADLLKAWSNWQADTPPFILEEDRDVLTSIRSTKASVIYTNWPDVYKDSNFAAPGDTRLHLGLLPHPFCGDLKNAEIYILMLNPGYGPWDYFGEFEVFEYRKAALSNLAQNFTSESLPFFMLDPQFSWHGGFVWWHGKFSRVIEKLSETKGISFAEARSELGNKVASIELMPYHSRSFHDSDNWIRDLPSVNLAKEYVKDYVIPRVNEGKAIAIVTRQASIWDLPEHNGVIRYSSQEARAAHLSPNSPGGKAILDRLTQSYKSSLKKTKEAGSDARTDGFSQRLADNLNRNVKLSHIDAVDHGIYPIDNKYRKFKAEFLKEWGKAKYEQESLDREQRKEDLYGNDWKSKRIIV